MRYIIDFHDNATAKDIQTYIQEHQADIIRSYDSLGKIYLVDTKTVMDTQRDYISTIVDNAECKIELLNHDTVEIQVSDEDQWWKTVSVGVPVLPTDTQIEIPANNRVFNVYLMDSGIDKSHPEFQGTEITQLYSLNNDFTDTTGHGTALASLISGTTTSIARANLIDVKVIDKDSTVTLDTLLAALESIKQHSEQYPETPAVINMSWGVEFNEYLNAKIQTLIDHGIAVVAAAGNNGSAISDVSPACIPDVYTVGAFDKEFRPADFSNYTPSGGQKDMVNQGVIDAWAPGVDIRVANQGGGHTMRSGTSMAAAIFTGSIVYSLSTMEEAWVEAFSAQMNSDANYRLVATNIGIILRRRRDMLLLPENYSEATNLIATYDFDITGAITSNWDTRKGEETELFVRRPQGGQIMDMAFLNSDVESFTVEGDLPPGTSIVNGFWLGKLPELNGSEYLSYEFALNILSMDGITSKIFYKCYVLPENPELLEDIPEDELYKELIIMPYNSGCEGGLYPFGCNTNDCTSVTPGFGGAGAPYNCESSFILKQCGCSGA